MDWANSDQSIFGFSLNPAFVDPGLTSGNMGTAAAPSFLDQIGGLLGASANAYAAVKGANAAAGQQVAQNGTTYLPGQFASGSSDISSTMLLIGAGVLLLMFLKD